MTHQDISWVLGRATLGNLARVAARLRVYGRDRIPPEGGLVVALNHFSWIDIPLFTVANPRNTYFVAKAEVDRVPGLGQFIREFGSIAIRRGESDREAVRRMREVVHDGGCLGVFVEGTRQRAGVPGTVQPGAAMAALQGGVPVVPAAVHGTQTWRVGNFAPVSVAFGEPMRFEGLPRNARGYREASREIEEELHRLWAWLRDLHELGHRPLNAVPPGRPPVGPVPIAP